jgi:hypothetical protein
MIKVSHENVITSYEKNKINGHDIKDEHMFTLVILKRTQPLKSLIGRENRPFI